MSLINDSSDKEILSVLFPANNKEHAPCSPGCCSPTEGECDPESESNSKNLEQSNHKLSANEILNKR